MINQLKIIEISWIKNIISKVDVSLFLNVNKQIVTFKVSVKDAFNDQDDDDWAEVHIGFPLSSPNVVKSVNKVLSSFICSEWMINEHK